MSLSNSDITKEPTSLAQRALTMAFTTEGVNKIVQETVKLQTKPKRALNAYNLFFKAERQKILEHGKAGGFAALAQTIAKRWKAISKYEYEEYSIKAKADKSRYEKEMAAWKETSVSSTTTEHVSEKQQIVKEIQRSMASQRNALLPANDKEWKSTVGSPSDCAPEHSNGLLGVRVQEQQSDLRQRSNPCFDASRCPSFDMQSVIDERNVQGRSSQDSIHRMLADMQQQLLSTNEPSAFGAAHGFRGNGANGIDTARILENSQGLTMRHNNKTGDFLRNNLDADLSPPQQAIFSPGTLRRVFDVDDAGMDQLPESDFGAPGFFTWELSTQELVNRMLKPDEGVSPPRIGY